jgi:hypothetical protein
MKQLQPPKVKPNRLITFATYVLPMIILIILGMFLGTTEHTANLFNPYVWIFMVLVPLCIMFFILQKLPQLASNGVFFGIVALCIAFLVLFFSLYELASSYSTILNTIFKYLVIILIVLVGLSILFSILSSYTKDGGWKGFWTKLFFYIPCMMIDMIVDFSKDLRVTPRPTLILLIIEIILIVVFFLGTDMMTWFKSFWKRWINPDTNNGSTVLLATPILLHTRTETILANNTQLIITTTGLNQQNPYRKTYSLSVWISINPNESITDETSSTEINVLYYASKSLDENNQWTYLHPKPRITYTHTKQDVFNIYVKEANEPYQLHIANQKWNQFMFVYNENHVDLFVNGYLVKTWQKTDGITQTYTNNDMIVIGDMYHKLYGAVGEVIYYDHAVTSGEIANLWNIGRLKSINGFQ